MKKYIRNLALLAAFALLAAPSLVLAEGELAVPTAFTTAITTGAVVLVTAVGAIMVSGLSIAGAIWGGRKVWRAFKGTTS